MKAVILAGGFGTRISETSVKPKPMVEIGGDNPLAYLKIFSTHGINEFVFVVGIRAI